RLWVASTDYSGELSISDEILKRVTEAYRRIRNTLRFLLANTSDFDPAKDAVPVAELVEIDRYAIANMAALQEEIVRHFETFEFHPVVAKLQMYCSEDLGGFYLDILKDRLYTTGADSRARRSAQTALWHITQALLRLMAPILSFTIEEAWAVFSSPQAYADSGETIFTQTWAALPAISGAGPLRDKYALLRAIRGDVMKRLEEVRIEGRIGSSLQALLELRMSGERYAALHSLDGDLRFLFITSGVTLTEVARAEEEAIVVTPSTDPKCERCWHYRADVGCDPAHTEICGRCVANLFGAGEPRRFA
ncbi:MAG: class I tRNA ligase family protein, partial [Burkholderiaceae bacterium]